MINTLLAVSASAAAAKILTYVVAILFFGIIIALHEFGHFITAKLFKMTVNEYSIGMGPALFKKQKNGTQYSLRLLPIGGYVALEGEDEDSEDPHAFNNQKAWKRFIVIAAGATLNIILGLLLMGVMLGMDGSVATPVVSDVAEELAEAENGVRVGDRILKIDGVNVVSARDIYYCLYRNESETFDIVVKRDGEKLSLTDVPVTYDGEQGICSFIVGFEDVSFKNFIPGTIRETRSMTKMILLSLVDMVRGRFGLKDLSGPVGTIGIVADTAGEAVASGDFASLFFMFAFITVNIGLVNLLPLPALDGGRLFFILIELIFRKPVPKKYEGLVHTVGIVLLLGLMALITFNDIFNLIKK